MSLTNSVKQGGEKQEVVENGAFVYGRFAITSNDSNDAPDIVLSTESSPGTPEDAIHLRIRTNGSIFFWDATNEIWKPTFPVNQEVLFSVGDGQQYSPEAGDTEYLNPDLENVSGGIIRRNGLPLLSGYSFLPEGGFQVDDPFYQGEIIEWSLETNITTDPIDYSIYTKRQDVATYANIVTTGADRLIFVAADETNGGSTSVFFLKNNTLKRIISQDGTAGAGQYQISLSLLQDALTSANSHSDAGDASTLAAAIAYAQGLAEGQRRVFPSDSPIVGETSVVPAVSGTFADFSGVVVSPGDFVASNVYIDLTGATWTKRVVTVPSPTFPFVKTSTMSGNVNAAAIKDIRMYGASRNKKYRLKELSRDFGSNSFYTLNFEEEGQARTQGVCGFRNFTVANLFPGGVEPTAGTISTMYLRDQNTSGITAEVDIIWSEVTLGVNLTFADYAGGGLDSRVVVKSDADRPVRFPNVSGDMSFITHTNWISAANIAPWWNSSNTWATTFPMQQLVSDIEIENAISPQQFYVSAIGKNTAGDIFTRIGLVGGSANYLGFQINGLDVSTKKTYKSKDGVNGISLTNSAGVTLKNITVDWPNVFLNTTTAFQSGSYAISGIASAVVKYREDADVTQQKFRLLHGSEMWTMTGEPLPVYGEHAVSGINTGVDETLNEGYKIRLDYSSDKVGRDVPFVMRVGNPSFINADDFDDEDTIRASLTILSSASNVIVNPSSVNGRDFKLYKFDPSELVGVVGGINLISDSITDYNIAGILGNRFVAAGANPNFIGTRTDGGFKNEGRATWDCKRTMGRRTLTNDNTPLKPATNTSQSASLEFNTFIRPATSLELSTIPEMCFENNAAHGDMLGRLTEKNYTESQLAGGAYVTNGYPYYTFSYSHYVTFNSLPINPADPLVVYSGLSYNDMTQVDTTGALYDVDLFNRVFTRSVYEYNNDAIILLGGIQLYNGKNNEPAFSECIERTVKQVNELKVNTSFTPRMDISFIQNFLNIGRVNTYDYNTNTPLNATNDTWVSVPIDATHPFELGQKQYSNSIFYPIAYKLIKAQ
jgi:hypothetical protein